MSGLSSPAFERNRDPILAVLRGLWGSGPRRVLELGSGPGQHVCYFAEALPEVEWQPTEREAALVDSIDAWRGTFHVGNVRPAVLLDVEAPSWGVPTGFDGVLAINVVHMVAEHTVRCILGGAAAHLRLGGHLVVYDCFTWEGAHVSESNARFDEYLRSTGRGGVYSFEAMSAWAEGVGLVEPEVHRLPANNQCVVWSRGGG